MRRLKVMVCFYFISLSIQIVNSVDRNNFKTCNDSGFCKRQRAYKPEQSPYELQMNTLKIHDDKVEGQVIDSASHVPYKVELFMLVNETIRFRITEMNPIRQRYEPVDALVREPKSQKLHVLERNAEGMTVVAEQNKVVVTAKPFRMDFYSGSDLVAVANARGLLNFEFTRHKPAEGAEEQRNDEENGDGAPVDAPVEPGQWEESFKSHSDSKPYGPASVGMDFSFIDFDYVYGIPEHADKFALKNTEGTDPFRLYNLDVFEYELDNPMAIYGSIPFMVAHNERKTVGLLWLNAAETWIDVSTTRDQNVVWKLVDYVKGQQQGRQTDTHWFSESGVIDTYILLGPTAKDVMSQYAVLTGTTELPPSFSIAYHQCRWNYNDQEDVNYVDTSFDQHDIPYDTLWLDIEHTDGKRYFTWEHSKFPTPTDMINNLTSKGRKMVTIIDPHIKRASGYFVHDDATSKGYYVKNKNGEDYEGWCWPGSSSWLDFLNPEVQNYWSSLFLLDKYQGSTTSLYTWNDMNEPSVFNGPEVTMHKDAKHFGDWEHRDVHNIYGFYQHRSTYNGHLLRSENQLRPFILTRAFFVGSQRYAAVWTGDNIAEWSHLRATIPMLLSLSISGISFCGADVGGFFKNPDPELFVRWYQAGSFQPFFRSHAHIDTRRREPWLFEENIKLLIRDAIRVRYTYLPYWYTLFYENTQNGLPPMRPLWMEFPSDSKTFMIENAHLVGNALLVHPVMEQGATSVTVYFPGEKEIWYDIQTLDKFEGTNSVSIPVALNKTPLYQRGGTIIPRKDRIRRSSSLGMHDPYTLIVALDHSGSHSNGSLYIDDGLTFDYKTGSFMYIEFHYENGKLKSNVKHGSAGFKTKSWLERVVVIGYQHNPSAVYVESPVTGKKELEFSHYDHLNTLVIRKPGPNMGDNWNIVIQ